MKTRQTQTAIDHFRHPATQTMHRRHQDIVFEILSEVAPKGMTLKEITYRFSEMAGYGVADSSLCAPLNTLKEQGRISDCLPNRPCRMTGRQKKVWAVAELPVHDRAAASTRVHGT